MKCCPRCGSRNLKYMPWLGEIYECKDCGYRGSFVIEDGELSELVKTEHQERISEKEERIEETEEEEHQKKRRN